MRIPETTIDEVRAASDIVSVVGEHVRLRQRGSNFVGLCPFHDEKTPSFNVSPSRGIFKCFGCGKGGNVFQFLMQVEALSFVEVVRKLADRAGIELPRSDQDRQRVAEHESLYAALRFAAKFFRSQLQASPPGKEALRYLRDRGLLPETIGRFGLGYAPAGWDGLLREASRQHIAPGVLERAGLAAPRKTGGGHYDRFRGRIMFPIVSQAGKVVGFGGRILNGDPDAPKYINSPETPVYSKSLALYGLFQGKVAIRKQDEAILVEGYTDVISLHQAGVEHVVATCGTALTPQQVRLVGRYARQMVLLFDADEAGARAAMRSVDLVLAGGLSPYAITLPEGSDPDSFVREKGGTAFQEYAHTRRRDFVEFMLETARLSGAAGTPEGEAETMRNVIAALRRIPDPLLQESYVRRARKLLRLPEAQLRRALEPERSRRVPVVQEARTSIAPEERMLLRLMADGGGAIIRQVLEHVELDEFSEGAAREVAALLFRLRDRPVEDIRARIAEAESEAARTLAVDVQMDRHLPSPNWQKRRIEVPALNERPDLVASDAIWKLKRNRLGRMASALQNAMRSMAPAEKERALQECAQLLKEKAQIQAADFRPRKA